MPVFHRIAVLKVSETYAKKYFFSQVVNLLNRLLKLEELLIKDKYALVVNGRNI